MAPADAGAATADPSVGEPPAGGPSSGAAWVSSRSQASIEDRLVWIGSIFSHFRAMTRSLWR